MGLEPFNGLQQLRDVATRIPESCFRRRFRSVAGRPPSVLDVVVVSLLTPRGRQQCSLSSFQKRASALARGVGGRPGAAIPVSPHRGRVQQRDGGQYSVCPFGCPESAVADRGNVAMGKAGQELCGGSRRRLRGGILRTPARIAFPCGPRNSNRAGECWPHLPGTDLGCRNFLIREEHLVERQVARRGHGSGNRGRGLIVCPSTEARVPRWLRSNMPEPMPEEWRPRPCCIGGWFLRRKACTDDWCSDTDRRAQ